MEFKLLVYDKVFRGKNMWIGKFLIYKIGNLVLGDSVNGNRYSWVCRCWFLFVIRNCVKSLIWFILGFLGKVVGEFLLGYLLYVRRGNKVINEYCDIEERRYFNRNMYFSLG